MAVVLLFECHQLVRKSLSELLAHEGHEVIVATALDSIAEQRADRTVDLYILDVTGLDGATCARLIKDQGITGQILGTRFDDPKGGIGEIIPWGLTKPFLAKEFLEQVRVQLGFPPHQTSGSVPSGSKPLP